MRAPRGTKVPRYMVLLSLRDNGSCACGHCLLSMRSLDGFRQPGLWPDPCSGRRNRAEFRPSATYGEVRPNCLQKAWFCTSYAIVLSHFGVCDPPFSITLGGSCGIANAKTQQTAGRSWGRSQFVLKSWQISEPTGTAVAAGRRPKALARVPGAPTAYSRARREPKTARQCGEDGISCALSAC